MQRAEHRSPRHRSLALVLALALLPTITYFGHWPMVVIPIPGTAYALTIPFASEEAAPGDHAAHCHGESARCSSGAGGSAIALGLLAATIAIALPSGIFAAARPAGRQRPRTHDPSLEPGPPRTVPAPSDCTVPG